MTKVIGEMYRLATTDVDRQAVQDWHSQLTEAEKLEVQEFFDHIKEFLTACREVLQEYREETNEV